MVFIVIVGGFFALALIVELIAVFVDNTSKCHQFTAETLARQITPMDDWADEEIAIFAAKRKH